MSETGQIRQRAHYSAKSLIADRSNTWKTYPQTMQTEGHIADARARLGLRIIKLRREQNMSQREFAQMVGINRTYLIDVEHGRRNIAFDNMMKIAGGLDITMSDLVYDIEYDGTSRHDCEVDSGR